jgi:MIHF family protein
MAIPQLSNDQLKSARVAATEARRARSQLKDQVKSGALTLSQALDKAMEDEVLSRMRVVDLLRALPRVGAARAQEVLESLDISPNRRVRGLGRRQANRLKEFSF